MCQLQLALAITSTQCCTWNIISDTLTTFRYTACFAATTFQFGAATGCIRYCHPKRLPTSINILPTPFTGTWQTRLFEKTLTPNISSLIHSATQVLFKCIQCRWYVFNGFSLVCKKLLACYIYLFVLAVTVI